ncbi:hypothetical protein GCWU000322_00566 [Eubacterium saphenum ATCC 49989]|nr:hypothetical protein GCWU000322_00566 [Eubacterium saphenum ATCC 49989]
MYSNFGIHKDKATCIAFSRVGVQGSELGMKRLGYERGMK